MSLLHDARIAVRDGLYAVRLHVRARLLRGSPCPLGADDAEVLAVVIPGVWDNWQFMRALSTRLAGRGLRVHFTPELGFNVRPIAESVAVVDRALDAVLEEAGHRPVVVIGHSKGGLIGLRCIAERIASGRRAPIGLVALSTPFGGTVWASRVRLPQVAELRIGSEAISRVRTDAGSGVPVVSIRPLRDPHVTSDFAPQGALRLRLRTSGHFQPLSTRAGARATLWGVRRLLRSAESVSGPRAARPSGAGDPSRADRGR